MTGPGCTATTSASTPKSLELELDQARHGLQRLVGIGLLARPRLIEQGERGQLARLRRIEQRHLALALDPLAFLGHRAPGPRCAAAAGSRPSSALRAPLPGAPACALGPEASSRRCSMLARAPNRCPCSTQAPILSMTSNHETPKNSATPASHRPSSSKVAPRKLRPRALPLPDQLAEHAARGLGKRPMPSQCRVARPQLVSSVRTNPAARNNVLMLRARIGQRLVLVHQPAGIGQHDREQIRRPAEQNRRRTRRAKRRRARSSCPPGPARRCRRSPGRRAIGDEGARATAAARARTSIHSVPSRSERATAAESLTLGFGLLSERRLQSNLDPC